MKAPVEQSITDWTPEVCPNCSASLVDASSNPFCSACGQNNSRPRLETKGVLLDALQNFIGWDAALMKTLRGLMTQPGRLVANYVSGKRRHYVNPARFCLLSLALWFFAMHLAGADPMAVSGIEVTSSKGEDQGHQVTEEIRAFLGRNLELLQYISLPFLAIFLRLLFRKSGRNLAECLVLVLYLIGFRYLLSILAVPFLASLPEVHVLPRIVFGPIWIIWAACVFFGRGAWSSTWRVLASMFLHMVCTVFLFGLIAIPWVLWGPGAP